MQFPPETEDTLRKYYERYDYNELGIADPEGFRQGILSAVYTLHLRWSPQIEAAVEQRITDWEHEKVMHFPEFSKFFTEALFASVEQQPECHTWTNPTQTIPHLATQNASGHNSEQNMLRGSSSFGTKKASDHNELDEPQVKMPDPVTHTVQAGTGTILEECNYHTWATLRATRPEANWFSAIMPLVMSLLLLTMQFTMCIMIVRELNSPRCLRNETCASGMVCLGLGDGEAGGDGNSGSCYDCYYTLTDSAWALKAAPDDIDAARAYCQVEDHHATCDFIDERYNMASGASLFVVVVIGALLCQAVVADRDEANTDWIVLALRLHQLHLSGNVSQGLRYGLFGLGYIISVIRMWLLGPLLMSSAISLMVQLEFTIENIILNGLATTFIMDMDNIVFKYLKKSTRSQSEEMMEELAKFLQEISLVEPLQITEHISILVPNEAANFWVARLVGLSLSMVMCVQSLDPDRLQGSETLRSDWLAFNGDGKANPISTSSHFCGEYSGVCLSPILAGIILQGGYGLFMQRLHWEPQVLQLNHASRAWIVIEQILSCGLTLAFFSMAKEFANYMFTKVVL